MAKRSVMTRRDLLKMGVVSLTAFLASCVPGNRTIPESFNEADFTAAAPTAAVPTAADPTATLDKTTSADPTATMEKSPTPAEEVCVDDEIPSETAGPFPADGSQASRQTLNALAFSGIVRRDLRPSLGTGTIAEGIPLELEMRLVDVNNNCAPLAGYAVYAWHCDQDGNYSMYSNATVAEDYLRGVQEADGNGVVRFTSIFPGCYLGRWPHIHFEIYESLSKATSANNIVLTSQLGFPEAECNQAYAADGYEVSVSNFSRTSLENDGVFRDGWESQIVSMSGNNESGYLAQLVVGIAV
ncbi:MAG TPA: intradiol ring-cleavage dioxygenase [Anaerolineales bacterium]|nr:intradiol ring-cleavage dioxygenase [Anaerolineales bacterium]